MRDAVRAHSPAISAFGVMLAIALLTGSTIQAALPAGAPAIIALPGEPLALPGPGEDADGDSFHDDVDRWIGDLSLRLNVSALRIDGEAPYLVVGTHDDQWRLGDELRWPHVVDHDPFGRRVGSNAWVDDVIRTGAWWYSLPADDASKAIAGVSELPHPATGPDVTWPQSFWIPVRDDRPLVSVQVELYDAGPDPDSLEGAWRLDYDVDGRMWRADDGPWHEDGATTTISQRGTLRIALSAEEGLSPELQREVAAKWAPDIHFAAGERFFPLPGETLQRFHGFAHQDGNWDTWTRQFTNGRDAYLLYLADFNGDRITDHEDAAVMTELLRAGGLSEPTVYTYAANTTADRFVIQYWFIYAYNFVQDESGTDIELLAHNGDREFVQLTFADYQAALDGVPLQVAYSEHYHGVRIPYEAGAAPWLDAAFDVYVAKGSHASYPVPGDDRRFRPAFAGFGDLFDGEGDVWNSGEYNLEVMLGQPWFQGYLWGPVTRHSRDLGTATKPLLQHSFRYPFIDPLLWQHDLREFASDELEGMFGRSA